MKLETRIDFLPETSLKKSNPEDNGISSLLLKELDDDIKNKFPHITSVLVLRHGNIVFEEYYNGAAVDSLHQIRSATKSILSALIGIAINEGDLQDVQVNAVEFFPEYVTSEMDTRINDISLKHLLTMTSGIPYDFMMYIQWLQWIQFNNPVEGLFTETLESKPGNKFNYNDPGVHMLSAILSKVSKVKASEYAEQYLFNELGINNFTWPTDSQGNTIGCAELILRTRDMAKFGQLYLNKGKWKHKQIIPSEWIEQSTTEQTNGGAPGGDRYGYLWWITRIEDYSAYYAFGFGGQLIYVVPDLDIVTVITSNLHGPHLENKTIMGKYIIPAVIK